MRARALAAVALLTPLTAGLLVAGAAPASAAVSAPGNGAVFSADAVIAIRAEYPGSPRPTRLTLQSPTGATAVLGSAEPSLRGGVLDSSLDTDCWVPEGGCAGRSPAPNGVWTLTLSGSEDSRSTFVLRVPPRAPADVTAAATSGREVAVSWRRGAEPDLTGWTVSDGPAVRQSVDLSACDGGTCRTVLRYDDEAAGERTVTVRALRATGPGSAETVESPSSAPVPVPPPAASAPAAGAPADPQTEGAPAEQPAPGAPPSTPVPTGAAAGGGGDDRRGGTGTATARRAFGPGFASPSGARGDAGPLPFPLTAPPPLAADPAAEQVLVAPRLTETAGDPDPSAAGRAGEALADVLGGEQVAISAAGILVLGLAFAHVRRWLGAPPADLV